MTNQEWGDMTGTAESRCTHCGRMLWTDGTIVNGRKYHAGCAPKPKPQPLTHPQLAALHIANLIIADAIQQIEGAFAECGGCPDVLALLTGAQIKIAVRLNPDLREEHL